MDECNPISTPIEKKLKLTLKEGDELEDTTKYRKLVIYPTTTRPTISFVVGILSRFKQKPCEDNWSTTKSVLKYLKGTQDFGLKYSKVDDFNLIGILI